MEYLNVFIPIITFFLGVAFTMFFRKREEKRQILTENTKVLQDLLSNWYDQLYSILVDIETGSSSKELATKIYYYYQNRKVLPRLLTTIEILRKHPGAVNIVPLAESFLSMVTSFDPNNLKKSTHFKQPSIQTRCCSINNLKSYYFRCDMRYEFHRFKHDSWPERCEMRSKFQYQDNRIKHDSLPKMRFIDKDFYPKETLLLMNLLFSDTSQLSNEIDNCKKQEDLDKALDNFLIQFRDRLSQLDAILQEVSKESGKIIASV